MAKSRKVGDPLECECPICTLAKKVFESPVEAVGAIYGEGHPLYIVGWSAWVADGRCL